MSGYSIGVDVGGTKVAYGLFSPNSNLLDRFQHPTPAEADGAALSDLIIENIDSLLQNNGLSKHDLQGVGVCMPSYILFDQGYICMTSAIPNIKEFAMRDYLSERLGVPVLLDNDSNVAALAEYRYGAGKGRKHMVYMAVSTGIGSGLILNGELFRGSYGWAGECGHMLITPDSGLQCGCGNQGCFMSWASGRYLPQHIRTRAEKKHTGITLGSDLDGAALLQACKENDPLALEILDQAAHFIAVCVYNVYQLLNVDLFVFGGGLTNFGCLLFDRVHSEFDRYNHIHQPVEFRFAELNQDFGIIGAAELLK